MRIKVREGDGFFDLLLAIMFICLRWRRGERVKEITADTCPLTKALKRESGLVVLRRAIVRAARNQKVVSFIELDLDRFKPVNDALGHEVGDEILAKVVPALEACFRRKAELVGCFRLGGDEFGVVLQHDSAIPIVQLQLLVARAVEKARAVFETETKGLLEERQTERLSSGQECPNFCSWSCGIVHHEPGPDVYRPEYLDLVVRGILRRADERMYQQKRGEVPRDVEARFSYYRRTHAPVWW